LRGYYDGPASLFFSSCKRLTPEKQSGDIGDFYILGFPDVFPVSAEHGRGITELLDRVAIAMPEEEERQEKPGEIRVSIIGRPNVGKSTLLNRLTGEDRSMVSPIAGTTRDAVDSVVEHDGTI
jgi:GTP-binding protein